MLESLRITVIFPLLCTDFYSSKMIVCDTADSLQLPISDFKNQGLSIGFVPTMGALHNGHVSLIKQAKANNDVCIVSIFVNPTQFNNKEDLDKYPITHEADKALIKDYCDLVFIPKSKEEVYTNDYTPTKIDLNGVDKVMEGEKRPGHFEGVVNVVNQLFKLIPADKAYFGIKDFQQLAIIRLLQQQLHPSLEIIPCDIVREENGLAMSSRNTRLSPSTRDSASIIYTALQSIKDDYPKYSLSTCVNQAITSINAQEGFTVEYLSICDHYSLKLTDEWHESDKPHACVAVFADKIRLIDNMSIID